MIHSPTAYIDSLPYRAEIKIIVQAIARYRLAGRRAQFGWHKQRQWLGRSLQYVANVHKSKGFNECVRKIRRGKKQTNLYYLQGWLWERLTKGRKVPHVKDPQGEPQLPESRPPSKLLELFRAELGKIAAPIP